MARVAISQMSTSRVNKREIQRKWAKLQCRAGTVFTLSLFPQISTRPSVPPHVSRRVPAFLTRARTATPRLN